MYAKKLWFAFKCRAIVWFSMPCALFLQSLDHIPVFTIPEDVVVQEIKVAVGTARKCFHLDVGVVYGINDTLNV